MSPTKFARNTTCSSNRLLALQISKVVMAGVDDDDADDKDDDIIDANDEDSNDDSSNVGEG